MHLAAREADPPLVRLEVGPPLEKACGGRKDGIVRDGLSDRLPGLLLPLMKIILVLCFFLLLFAGTETFERVLSLLVNS